MADRRSMTSFFTNEAIPPRHEPMLYSFTMNGTQTPNSYYSMDGPSTVFVSGGFPDAGGGILINPSVPGTFDKLYIGGPSPTSGAGETFTVYTGAGATTVTAHATAGATFCEDMTHSFHVNKGDLIALYYDATSAAAWTGFSGSIRFTPD